MDTRHSKHLPQDLYLFHIFKQLTAKEVSSIRSVSQEWNTMGEKFLKKTKNQEFFMVGNNIPFATKSLYNISILPYCYIDSKVIKESFPKKGFVKLFKSEKESKDYARSLRIDDKDIAEPAIFKVQFTGKIPKSSIKEFIAIKKMQIPYLLAPKYTRKTEIQYFEANIEQLIPMTGTLQIDIYDRGTLTDYGSYDFQNPHSRLTR